MWVVANIPVNTIYKVIGDDLVWIMHVRNTGIAFSLGSGGSDFFRLVTFTVVPLIAMIWISVLIVKNKVGFTNVQRWYVAGIIGGGMGTLIDRMLYFNEGVIDFISIKFFGIFGLDRWPTFNVSDSCVVVFVILFAITLLLPSKNGKK